MFKYFNTILSLFFIFSCVGKLEDPSIVKIKGNYQLELIDIYRAEDYSAKWTKHKITSTDVFEVKLGDIAYDLELHFKLSKISSSKNILISDNKFEINTKNSKGLAFEIKHTDCNEPVAEYCNIVILAKWHNGENVALGELDFIDFELEEQVLTSIEEAVSFSVSIDTHRKQKSSVNFNLSPETIDFGQNIDFFTTISEEQFIKFSIDGELDYEIIPILEHNTYSNAFSIACSNTEGTRNNYCDISFKELLAGAYSFTNNPAKLNLAIKFENETAAKQENIKTIDIKGRRNAAPNIIFIGNGNLTTNETDFTIKNTGENKSTVDSIQLIPSATNHSSCSSGFKLINNCTLSELFLNDTCQVKMQINYAILGENNCSGYIKYIGDSNRTIKQHQVAINATPSLLKFYSDIECTNEITSKSFNDTLVGSNSLIDVYLKNIGVEPSMANVLDAVSIGNTFISNPNNVFSIDEDLCGDTIAGKVTCKITLKYTPNANNNKAGSFKITYTDSSLEGVTNDLTLGISGLGRNPALINLATSYDFGQIVNNSALAECEIGSCNTSNYYKAKTRIVNITNTGEWTASNLNFDFSSNTYFTRINDINNNCTTTLEKDHSCNIKIKFYYNVYDDDDGIPVSEVLPFAYNNGLNTTTITRDLTGTILVPGVIKILRNNIEVTSEIALSDRVYNHPGGAVTPWTFKLENYKQYSTNLVISNLTMSLIDDFDGQVDDFKFSITDPCKDVVLNSNSTNNCTFIMYFSPVGESDYTEALKFYEKINLLYTNQNHINIVKRLKKYNVIVNYNNIVGDLNKAFVVKGYSLKPAELLIRSVSYNSSTLVNKEIDRDATSYSRVTKYVNQCTDGKYMLFSDLPNSECYKCSNNTYGTISGCTNGSGVPLQTYWDFDKEHSSYNNTSNDFSIELINIGGVESQNLSYNLDNSSKIEIGSVFSIDSLRKSSGIKIGFKPDAASQGQEIERLFYGFKYRHIHRDTDILLNYSDYASSYLTFYGFSLRPPYIETSFYLGGSASDPVVVNFFYGTGPSNFATRIDYDFIFKAISVNSPYGTNMPGGAYFNINNISTLNLNSFMNTAVTNYLDSSVSFTNNIPAFFSPLSSDQTRSVIIDNIKFIDEGNTLCEVNQKTFYVSYNISDWNKFSPINDINIEYSENLTLNIRPAISFSPTQNAGNENMSFCIADFGSNLGSQLKTFNNVKIKNISTSSLYIDFANSNNYYNPSTINDFIIENVDCGTDIGNLINPQSECFVNLKFQRNIIQLKHAYYDWYYLRLPYKVVPSNLVLLDKNFDIKAKAKTGKLADFNRGSDIRRVFYYKASDSTQTQDTYYCYDFSSLGDRSRYWFKADFQEYTAPYNIYEIRVLSPIIDSTSNIKNSAFNFSSNGFNYFSYSNMDFPFENVLSLTNFYIKPNNLASFISSISTNHNQTDLQNNVFNQFFNFNGQNIAYNFNIRILHGYSTNEKYLLGVKQTSDEAIKNDIALQGYGNSNHFLVSKAQLVNMCTIINNKVFIDTGSPIYGQVSNYINPINPYAFKEDCCTLQSQSLITLNAGWNCP